MNTGWLDDMLPRGDAVLRTILLGCGLGIASGLLVAVFLHGQVDTTSVALTIRDAAQRDSGRHTTGLIEAAVESNVDAIFSATIRPNEPGAAVLVRKDGRDLFSRGYGVRDLHSLASVDEHTNFRLASCTKQFTAMAIMLLVHDGKLRYEDRLTDVFPDFPAYGKDITIRHLLDHTSGLPDYEELMVAVRTPGNSPAWTEARQIQDAEVLRLLAQERAGKFPAGTKWAYSNSGYVLLGLVVGKVSGQTFGEFLRARVFAPLQMNHTLAYQKGESEVANRAYGHTRDGRAWKQTDQSATSATLGDGGVYSSLADLAKWDDALARPILLSQGEMRAAFTPVRLADGSQPKWPPGSDRPAGTPVSYGFGWFLDPYGRHARMWHYGDTRGFHTYIERFTRDKLSIIVLCNRSDLDAEKLAGQVADLFLATRR
jgi:CubicO group peptidase (beta-lactamase class C family)